MTAWRVRAFAIAAAVGVWGCGIEILGAEPLEETELCRTADVTTQRRVPIDVRPSYFFKVVAGTPLVAMTTEHGNALLDLRSDRAHIQRIPGSNDPVPSFPDGKVMSVASGTLRFYALADLLQHGLRARPFFKSRHVMMSGAYQSMARISYADDWARYRVIVVSNQDGRLRSQQIVVRFRGGVPTEVSDQSRPRRLCKNLAAEATNLPMLSKSGQEISLFDGRSTKVFRLDNTECTQVLDVGVPTGKVDFSFDDRRLTFHVGLTRHVTTRTPAQPDMQARLSTWIYDRDALPGVPALRPVTLSPTGNTYYPVFTAHDQVLYLHAVPGKQGPDYSFVYAEPLAMKPRGAGEIETSAEAALGRLWRSVCTDEHPAASVLAPSTVAPHLDPAACRRLITTRWTRNDGVEPAMQSARGSIDSPANNAFGRLDIEDLLAACP